MGETKAGIPDYATDKRIPEEGSMQDGERPSFPKINARERDWLKNARRRGRRALYDLPQKLIKTIAAIAEEARLTNSQVAGFSCCMPCKLTEWVRLI